MKIAISQISTDPGFVKNNVAKMKLEIDRAEGEVDILVFPELAVPGYLPLDLILDDGFVRNNIDGTKSLRDYTEGKDIYVVVGYVEVCPTGIRPDGLVKRYNSLAVLHDGKNVKNIRKDLLPSYDIFYEKRYFSIDEEETYEFCEKPPTLKIKDKNIGFFICEDLWDENYDKHPLPNLIEHTEMIGDKLDFVITINASPFVVNKKEQRHKIIQRAARISKCPIIYANRSGAIDGYDGEIVFDGSSCVFNGNGELLIEAPSFQESFTVYNSEKDKTPVKTLTVDEIEQKHNALICGVKEYFRRSGFKKALIGLSGGIDSAVVAALAVEAIGADNVLGVTMPSKYSTDKIKNTAYQLAKNLGIKINEIPIYDSVYWLEESLSSHYRDDIELEHGFLDLNDLAQQNIQARVRGNMLMAISNELGYLVLSTGNKTEVALGYCTLYGDMSGGLAVISDVNKMDVYGLARFVNKKHGKEIVPNETIELPPSAELKDGQTDEESLGAPYSILSPLVDAIIEGKTSVFKLSLTYDEKLVAKIYKMIKNAEYKRRQAPPGIKITDKSFGIGRRLPMFHDFAG
jgi:NAD+ synthase (glutamine-hydrolysing)